MNKKQSQKLLLLTKNYQRKELVDIKIIRPRVTLKFFRDTSDVVGDSPEHSVCENFSLK